MHLLGIARDGSEGKSATNVSEFFIFLGGSCLRGVVGFRLACVLVVSVALKGRATGFDNCDMVRDLLICGSLLFCGADRPCAKDFCLSMPGLCRI